MLEEKLYRVRTKDGSHINEKINADGYRSAIQFDKDNGLQGPLEIREVDKSELVTERVVYIEQKQQERSFGKAIVEDAVVPAMADALELVLTRAVDAGIDAFGNWMSQKVFPVAKEKGGEFVEKTKEIHAMKKAKKQTQKLASFVAKKTIDKTTTIKITDDTVVHTPGEVNQILNNMKFASLYIAAGIRELSKTVVSNDEMNPETVLEMQNRVNELSSGEVMRTIDFMLEEKNRVALDMATIQLFEAFRNRDFIVDGKAVPISRYLVAIEE